MRKKFGFKDFISKSLPLKANLLSYTPLTRRTFTDMSQIKRGMKLVYYHSIYGCILTRRNKNPTIVVVTRDFNPTDTYVQGKTKYNTLMLLSEKEIFFYEEEKALGRVE